MRRGHIWTAAAPGAYTSKPRPVVILQDDHFDTTESVTIAPFTSDPAQAPLFRLRVEPSPSNGLRTASSIMIDKITTVPRSALSESVGGLGPADLVRLNAAIVLFLGVAG